MSAKPLPDREMMLARIARALGCAMYPVEECDAILAWVTSAHPASGTTAPRGAHACAACNGRGRVAPVNAPISGAEQLDGLSEQTAFLLQGVCLACSGDGFNT